ncbi:MAG: class I SAM-dependent methyltransferase [Myxococcota bacterium]
MSFKDHFSQASQAYAQSRPRYSRALVDFLADVSPSTGLAWDVGCGSGQLSTLLPERFAHVIATDASAQQLEHAEAHPKVEYRHAPAEASGLDANVADCITVAQAAHWFELPRFYAEVRRVARVPASVIALITYSFHSVAPAVDEVVGRFALGTLADFWPKERRHVDAGYASLDFPFARLDVPPLELVADWEVDAMLGYIRTWSATSAFLRAGHEREVQDFEDQVRSAWGSIRARRVTWPLTVVAGRVGA